MMEQQDNQEKTVKNWQTPYLVGGAVIGGLILDKAAITWMYSILNLQYICQEPVSRYKSDQGKILY